MQSGLNAVALQHFGNYFSSTSKWAEISCGDEAHLRDTCDFRGLKMCPKSNLLPLRPC